MTISAITLNAQSLEQLSEYEIIDTPRGGITVLANGALRRDLVDSSMRKLFRLTWYALTGAQLATLRTAHASAIAGVVAWADPDGDSYYVTADETGSLNTVAYKSGGSLVWRCTAVLREAESGYTP
jgi:hypothetical protein